MLTILLLTAIALMIVSMTIAVVQVRSEGKNWISKLWVGLACFSVLTVMGTAYMALEGKETLAVTEQQPSGNGSNQPAASPVRQLVDHEPKAPGNGLSAQVPAGQPQAPEFASPSEQAAYNGQIYQYLVEVLELLKKGESIPEKYWSLLSELDRQKLHQNR